MTADPRTVSAVASYLAWALDEGRLGTHPVAATHDTTDQTDATALPACAASGLPAHAPATMQRDRAVARRTDRRRGNSPGHASGRDTHSTRRP